MNTGLAIRVLEFDIFSLCKVSRVTTDIDFRHTCGPFGKIVEARTYYPTMEKMDQVVSARHMQVSVVR